MKLQLNFLSTCDTQNSNGTQKPNGTQMYTIKIHLVHICVPNYL